MTSSSLYWIPTIARDVPQRILLFHPGHPQLSTSCSDPECVPSCANQRSLDLDIYNSTVTTHSRKLEHLRQQPQHGNDFRFLAISSVTKKTNRPTFLPATTPSLRVLSLLFAVVDAFSLLFPAFAFLHACEPALSVLGRG